MPGYIYTVSRLHPNELRMFKTKIIHIPFLAEIELFLSSTFYLGTLKTDNVLLYDIRLTRFVCCPNFSISSFYKLIKLTITKWSYWMTNRLVLVVRGLLIGSRGLWLDSR